MSATVENVGAESELDECFDCLSRGFGREKPLLNALYPEHDKPRGRRKGLERLRAGWKAHREDSTFHYLKAVVDGHVAGFAIWVRIEGGRNLPEQDADKEFALAAMYAPEQEDEKEWLRQVWWAYVQPRQTAIVQACGDPLMAMELCVVHPDFQRRGIGQLLTAWGVEEARRSGASEAVVEASKPGVGCYARCGFMHSQPIDFSSVEGRLVQSVRKLPDLVFMRTGPLQ